MRDMIGVAFGVDHRVVSDCNAKDSKDGIDKEITFVQAAVENAKAEVAVVESQLNGAESEVKSLRSITHKMILTQKEMVMMPKIRGAKLFQT
ncbi:hypothetical protein PIB30_011857 [Stylosanthes scabra]|uniref:Uncharacterized protein n=1 Tax=Stylosanthes scabra TaxID=79078 RepID=A0ABU6T5V7_9FABA|nr:hypothetical protein [Stylosanthes scabra]